MQRSRCYAANVYDASTAPQATFGRVSRQQCLKRTDSHAFDHPRLHSPVTRSGNVSARRLYRSATTYGRRALSTSAGPAGDTLASDRRSRKLEFYEAASDVAQHQVEHGSRHGAKSWDYSRNETRKRPSVDDWRDHMFAISTFVREQKISNDQRTSEAPRVKLHDPKNVYTIEGLDDLDYEGFYIPIRDSNAKSPGRLPWTPDRVTEEQKSSAKLVLECEITAFAKYMKLSTRESNARKAVRILIEKFVARIPDMQSTKVFGYGSFRTGLSMPYSDVDIGLSNDGRAPGPSAMEELYNKLLKGNDFLCVLYRPEGGIITAQHKSTGIDVQILAKGKRGAQDEKVAKYVNSIPNMRELYMVVRTALGMRGLVDPYIGGISAYGTFMMLATALTAPSTPRKVHNSPAKQLRCFLAFWADFDTTKYGIKFNGNGNSGRFEKIAADKTMFEEDAPAWLPTSYGENARPQVIGVKAVQDRIGRFRPGQPYLLCLEDPAWSPNDLGKRCHAIKHILQTIKVLHANLERSMAQYDEALKSDKPSGQQQQQQQQHPSFLLPLVGSCEEMSGKRRNLTLDTKITSIIKSEYARNNEKYARRARDSASFANVTWTEKGLDLDP